MNVFCSSFAALTLVIAADSMAAEAGHPAIASFERAGARIVVDCGDERLPSLRDVAELLETNNAGLVYAERERLAHTAHRECARGTPRVVFFRDASSAPALAMSEEPER